MAVIHGKNGTVVFSGGTFLVTSFTVTTSVDLAEKTDMADTWKTYLAGFKDWTATAETHYDSAGLGLATLGTIATLTLDTVGGLAFSGQALCTGHSVNQDMSDTSKATWSFQGTGVLGEA